MAYGLDEDITLAMDKFIFRFPQTLLYSEEGLWIRLENGLLRAGVSDFAQQRNGDVTFAGITPAGTELKAGDEVASIETVKVTLSLTFPVGGKVLEINASLQDSPELINLEPYGRGWLAVLLPDSLEQTIACLLTAEAYSSLARLEAESELES